MSRYGPRPLDRPFATLLGTTPGGQWGRFDGTLSRACSHTRCQCQVKVRYGRRAATRPRSSTSRQLFDAIHKSYMPCQRRQSATLKSIDPKLLQSDRPKRARHVLNASVSSDRSGSGGADQSRAVRCQGSSNRTWTFPRRRTVYLPPEPAFLVVKLLLLGEHRQDCREAFLPRLGLLRRLQSPNNCIHICSV